MSGQRNLAYHDLTKGSLSRHRVGAAGGPSFVSSPFRRGELGIFLHLLPGADLAPLAKHSPGLKGYEWSAYIRLSLLRLRRTDAAIRKAGVRGGQLMDFGAYFGNFSLFARQSGFDVDAIDNYSARRPIRLLRSGRA